MSSLGGDTFYPVNLSDSDPEALFAQQESRQVYWGTRLLLAGAALLPDKADFERSIQSFRGQGETPGTVLESIRDDLRSGISFIMEALEAPDVVALKTMAKDSNHRSVAKVFATDKARQNDYRAELRRWRLERKGVLAIATTAITGTALEQARIDRVGDVYDRDALDVSNRGMGLAWSLTHDTYSAAEREIGKRQSQPWTDFNLAWQRLISAQDWLVPNIPAWPPTATTYQPVEVYGMTRDFGVTVPSTSHWTDVNRSKNIQVRRQQLLAELGPQKSAGQTSPAVRPRSVNPEERGEHTHARYTRRYYVDKRTGLLGCIAMIDGFTPESNRPNDLYIEAQNVELKSIETHGLIAQRNRNASMYISADDTRYYEAHSKDRLRRIGSDRTPQLLKDLAISSSTPLAALQASASGSSLTGY